jgi:hypothetical protein
LRAPRAGFRRPHGAAASSWVWRRWVVDLRLGEHWRWVVPRDGDGWGRRRWFCQAEQAEPRRATLPLRAFRGRDICKRLC